MAKRVRYIYPWKDTPLGARFFVPTLDAERVVREGLQAAVRDHAVPEQPLVGVFEGKFGVLFRRRR